MGAPAELLGDAPGVVFDLIEKHAIACEIERNGTLHCAVGAKGLAELQERARQWQARGAPVHLLDAAQTARKVGTDAYAGALLDLRAGTIQPLAYARGLASGSNQGGSSDLHLQPRRGRAGDRRRMAGAHRQRALSRRTGSSSRRMPTRPMSGRRSAPSSCIFPTSTSPPSPLATTCATRSCPSGRASGTRRRSSSSFRLDQQGRLVFGSVGALRGPGRSIHPDWGAARSESSSRTWPCRVRVRAGTAASA